MTANPGKQADDPRLQHVEALIAQGQLVLETEHKPSARYSTPRVDEGLFRNWQSRALRFLDRNVGPNDAASTGFRLEVAAATPWGVTAGLGILRGVQADLLAGALGREATGRPDTLAELERICDRFHLVARQLRSRFKDRATLDVDDEYDVQDLLHALLRLSFEDVRPEEHTPSYGGKSSRMDFLLKREQVVVEVKKTRVGLGAKELGTQLIEDIARYEHHPDCKVLVCFVYDPEGRVANPRGLEDDLSRAGPPLPVRVIIRPR